MNRVDKSIIREVFLNLPDEAPGIKKFNMKLRDISPFTNAQKVAEQLVQVQKIHLKRM